MRHFFINVYINLSEIDLVKRICYPNDEILIQLLFYKKMFHICSKNVDDSM